MKDREREGIYTIAGRRCHGRLINKIILFAQWGLDIVHHSSVTISQVIWWQFPPDPFIKLNTDGSVLGNPGLAGAGGLLRNSSGDWLSGFSLHLGISSNNMAELAAVHQGLILA